MSGATLNSPSGLPLSLVVITRNEAANIGACIDSVPFAAQVVVVDSGSDDGTQAIAQQRGAQVIHREWDGFAEQRQFAFEQATQPWILWLDADERLTPEADAAVRAAVENPAADGYYVARRHWLLGDWLRHSGQYPAEQLRLFRRERARLHHFRLAETIITDGMTTATLAGDLDHFSTPSLRTRLAKNRRDAVLAAEEADLSGRLSEIGWGSLFITPLRRIAAVYIRQDGWRDGWRGALWSALHGWEHVLILRYVGARKLARRRRS